MIDCIHFQRFVFMWERRWSNFFIPKLLHDLGLRLEIYLCHCSYPGRSSNETDTPSPTPHWPIPVQLRLWEIYSRFIILLLLHLPWFLHLCIYGPFPYVCITLDVASLTVTLTPPYLRFHIRIFLHLLLYLWRGRQTHGPSYYPGRSNYPRRWGGVNRVMTSG